MKYPKNIDTLSMELSILYFKGMLVKIDAISGLSHPFLGMGPGPMELRKLAEL